MIKKISTEFGPQIKSHSDCVETFITKETIIEKINEIIDVVNIQETEATTLELLKQLTTSISKAVDNQSEMIERLMKVEKFMKEYEDESVLLRIDNLECRVGEL